MSIMQGFDPKLVELREKYQNARDALMLAYKYADSYYLNDSVTVNPQWVEGSTEKKYVHTPPTDEERIAHFFKVSRALAAEIQKDLDNTLNVLEEKK